ncbi:class I SAM-dependent methyltransferase [Geminocystis sp. CENA526]|uniref:class I SAM-dependent methyltransferase n=1 Tax=Geminocystis sp. CENA526 TaxID=1355871 RepID=UPI003D6ED7F7
MLEKNLKSLTEEDIRPAKLMIDQQKCVEVDRQFLLSNRNKWVEVSCPACMSSESNFYGEKEGFTYVECKKCGTVYTNPRPSLNLMHEFYANSQNYAYWNKYIFPATEDNRRERIFCPRAKKLVEYCRKFGVKTNTLLEVGAAFGTFCEEIRKENLFQNIIALEMTPDLASTCRGRGFEVLEMSIEGVQKDQIADVIASFEVIEHLFSPHEFIMQCSRLLKPNGLLVLSCPNVRGFDVATLKTLSSTFDHEHVNYFHPQSLSLLVEQCGFKVLEVQTPGQLDADLVRKQAVNGLISLDNQPFLQEILINRWDEIGDSFQKFLADHKLSSHMWIVAQKI